MWSFYDEIENHIQGLANQGITGYQTEVFLCPLILGRLPLQIRSKWCEFRDSKITPLVPVVKDNLDNLLKF